MENKLSSIPGFTNGLPEEAGNETVARKFKGRFYGNS